MDRFKTFVGSNQFHVALVCLILILSIVLRLYQFVEPQYPERWRQLTWPDYSQEYIVANHIVTYGELPMNGPGYLLGADWVSPLYYYFVSGILLIHNDIKFLSLFNVFLQILSLLGVYALARTIFGKGTGLIALTLFGLSNAIIWQSYIIWQPHVMQPFIILSYLLLALGYKRKSIPLLIYSIAVFLISVTLHYSVLVVAPAYLVLLILSFRRAWAKTKDYILAGTVAVAIGALLYAPVIIFMSSATGVGEDLSSLGVSELDNTETVITENLSDRVFTFFNFFLDNDAVFFRPISRNASLIYTAMGAVFAAMVVYFLKKKKDEKYYIVLLITSTISSFLLITAFINVSFEPRYLTPIMSLTIIILSEIVYRIGGRNMLTSIMRIGVVLGLVYLLLLNDTDWGKHGMNSVEKIIPKASSIFVPESEVNNSSPLVQSIILEIRALSKTQESLNFFDFEFYDASNDALIGYSPDEPLWVQLENEFDTKLVMVDSATVKNFSPIAKNPEYIFLICWYQKDMPPLRYERIDNLFNDNSCLDAFSGKRPAYSFSKKIYSSKAQSVLLMGLDN